MKEQLRSLVCLGSMGRLSILRLLLINFSWKSKGYAFILFKHRSGNGSNYRYKPRYESGSGFNVNGIASKFELFVRFLTTRAFLLNLGFAG